MKSARITVACALGAIGLCVSVAAGRAAAPVAPEAQNTVRSVDQGVYTAAQAERGMNLFVDHCGSCHEPERFVGPRFVAEWQGPLDVFFKSVRSTMPEDNPGGLAPQAYADVIAYLLNINGYPAGNDRLEGTLEAMQAIHLVPAGVTKP